MEIINVEVEHIPQYFDIRRLAKVVICCFDSILEVYAIVSHTSLRGLIKVSYSPRLGCYIAVAGTFQRITFNFSFAIAEHLKSDVGIPCESD
jgi:hypothetical protein